MKDIYIYNIDRTLSAQKPMFYQNIKHRKAYFIIFFRQITSIS